MSMSLTLINLHWIPSSTGLSQVSVWLPFIFRWMACTVLHLTAGNRFSRNVVELGSGVGAILANTALVGALQMGLPTNESKFFCTVRVSYRVKREVPFQALESKLLFHTSVIFPLRVNDGTVWTASLTVVVVRLVTRGLKMASLQA